MNDLMAKIDSLRDSGLMQPNFSNRIAQQFRFSGMEQDQSRHMLQTEMVDKGYYLYG